MFGKDFKELATPDADKDAKFAMICEGCGWTVVNKDGECLHCLMDAKGPSPGASVGKQQNK